jgi:hypothetical protein
MTVFVGRKPTPTKAAGAPKASSQVTQTGGNQPMEPPSPEELPWIRGNLNRVLNETAPNYPIQSIRQLFVLQREQLGRKRAGMIVNRFPHNTGLRVLAWSFHSSNGQPILCWSLPALKYVYTREGYEDLVITTYLHETFHLLQQPSYVPGQLSRNQLVERELEAWWWEIEKVILPMRENGRLKGVLGRTEEVAIQAYRAANGDPSSPHWRAIGSELSLMNL